MLTKPTRICGHYQNNDVDKRNKRAICSQFEITTNMKYEQIYEQPSLYRNASKTDFQQQLIPEPLPKSASELLSPTNLNNKTYSIQI